MMDDDTISKKQIYLSGAHSYQRFCVGRSTIFLFGCFHHSSGHRCNPCRQPYCYSIAMFIKHMSQHRRVHPDHEASLLTEDVYYLSNTTKRRYNFYKPVDVIMKTSSWLRKRCTLNYIPLNIRMIPMFASVAVPIMCVHVRLLERQSTGRSVQIEPRYFRDVYSLACWTTSSHFWDFLDLLMSRKHSYGAVDERYGRLLDTEGRQSFDAEGSHLLYVELQRLPVRFRTAIRSFVDHERSRFAMLIKVKSVRQKLKTYAKGDIDDSDLLVIVHISLLILCLIQDVYALIKLCHIIERGCDAYCVFGEFHRVAIDRFFTRDLKSEPSASFVLPDGTTDDCIKLI